MLEDSLKDITKGASIIIIGMIIANLVGLINQILMGRILGPAEYGLFNLGISLMVILCVLPHFGLGQGLTQFIPYNLKQKKFGEIEEAVNFSLKFTFIVGLLVSVLLFVFSNQIALNIFHTNELESVLKLLAIALPFWALHNTAGSLTQGFKKPKYYVYIENISMVILQLLIFVTLSFLGYKLFGALVGFTISSIFASIAYIYVFRVKFGKNFEKQDYKIHNKRKVQKEILILSYPLFLAGSTFLFMQYADKILLGIYTNPTDVGIYTAALTIATLVLFIYTAFSFNSRPALAEYFAINDIESMRRLYSSVTKWIFLVTFPLVVYLVFYSKDILGLIYGDKFTSGAIAMSILCLGFAMNGLTGLSGETLISIKKTKLNLSSEVVGAISNVLLNVSLIPFFGIIGAAIGTSLSIALKNIVSLIFVYKNLKFNPYNSDYIKIILYSTIPLLGIYLLFNKCLNITWSFLFVIPLFLVVYFAILTITNFFDEFDQLIINKIISKFGNFWILKRLFN